MAVSRRGFLFGAVGASLLGGSARRARAQEGVQFPEELMRPPGVDGAPLATPPAWRVPGAPEEMAGRTIEQQQLLRQMPISEIAFPRYEPGRIYSPPPPLMGAQMGRVHTLNVPPLGYELDGDVKVFHLIAQPVWRELTDGDASHLKLPQIERNIFGGAGKWIGCSRS